MSIEEKIAEKLKESLGWEYQSGNSKAALKIASEILSLPAEGWVVYDRDQHTTYPTYLRNPATIGDVLEGKAQFLGMEEGE